MVTSESIKNISAAMIKVQTEIKGMTPDAKNPFFHSNYITLDGILEYIRPILSSQGLWLSQNASGDGEYVQVTTRLVHESGEFIETDVLKMKPTKNEPQQLGSCITYAKRYQLSSLLGISSEVDDDGNGAAPKTPNNKKPKNDAQKPVEQRQDTPTINTSGLISEAQRKRLYAIAKANQNLLESVVGKFGYSGTKEIKISDYEKIANEIQKEASKQ